MDLQTSLEPQSIRPVGMEAIPSEQLVKARPLTRKQRLFVNYYLRGNNAAKSARMAGFSDSVANNATIELVRHPQVARAIQEKLNKAFQEIEITTERIIQETAVMATSNLADYSEVSEDGKTVNANLAGLDRNQWACIQELSYDNNGKLKVKLYDKKTAQELYGRFKQIGLQDNTNQNTEDGKPLTIKTLDDIVQKAVTINQTNYNTIINQNSNPNLPQSDAKLIEGTQSTDSK